MRYAQLVIGPAGAGKSTYCTALQRYGEDIQRTIQVVNLDPAAELFKYSALCDVRDLITLSDVMEDPEDGLDFGPNGGLIFCMEHLLNEGMDWLEDQLGQDEDDYILFDCPGQIELFTHMDLMKRFVEKLQGWNFRVCAVFVLDSHFMVDTNKFISGSLAALSTMMNLQIPHVNIMSKTDLLDKKTRRNLDMYLDIDVHELMASGHSSTFFNKKFERLTAAVARTLEDESLVHYIPINITKHQSIAACLHMIDMNIQYGEDIEVKTKDFDFVDPETVEAEEE